MVAGRKECKSMRLPFPFFFRLSPSLLFLRLVYFFVSTCAQLTQKTEGLELGAVDKLLVGIFVGCDGEEEETPSQLTHPRPSYLFFQLLSNNHVRFRIMIYILSNRISINSLVRILASIHIED